MIIIGLNRAVRVAVASAVYFICRFDVILSVVNERIVPFINDVVFNNDAGGTRLREIP